VIRPEGARPDLQSGQPVVIGPVLHPRIDEGAPALGALVAPAAVFFPNRTDTGEGQLQGEPLAQMDYLCFGETSERSEDLQWMGEGVACQTLKAVKKGRGGVGEGVPLQQPQSDDADPVKGAIDRGLGEEQEVSPRKIDGAVLGVSSGNGLAGGAPVGLVGVLDWKTELLEGLESGVVQVVQKPPEPYQLDAFPDQAGPDIERSNLSVLFGKMGQQNAAIQPAADQHTRPAMLQRC